jgi:hypothetical protein
VIKVNVTLDGVNAEKEYDLGFNPDHDNIKRLVLEEIRSGQFPGLHRPDAPDHAFQDYMVDDPVPGVAGGPQSFFLRPKTPFGA